MNRDSIDVAVVVDAGEDPIVTVPDAGDRNKSVEVVDQDRCVPTGLHDAGEHSLSSEQLGTGEDIAEVRTMVDPADPDDVAAVNTLQDQLEARNHQPLRASYLTAKWTVAPLPGKRSSNQPDTSTCPTIRPASWRPSIRSIR